MAVVATVAADPLVFTSPYVSSPYVSAYAQPFASAAYVASPSAAVVAAPAVSAAVPAVATALPAPLPYSSVSAYSYGSAYSVQDYSVPTLVNSAAPLAYSLPYPAYAADYYYRR